MSRPVCTECGDTKPLNDLGVCAWRHGCEHRQLVHEATIGRLLAEFDHQDFHVRAREAYSRAQAEQRHPSNQQYRPSGLDPIQGGAERTNLWLDQWLHGNGGADDTDLDDGEEL